MTRTSTARPTATTRRSLCGALGVLALVALTSASPVTRAEQPARDVSQFNLGKNALALEGFDPVTYFAAGGGKPRKGELKFELVHDGVRYRFVNQANQAAFSAAPAKFEPAYGGWCAYAMADKEKVEVDVESFVVRAGRLFLFYQGFFNDTRAKWSKKPADYTVLADVKWAELIAPPRPRSV